MNNNPNNEEFKNSDRNGIYIVLDNFKSINDMGAIFRLADATLVKKVYIYKGENVLNTPEFKEASKEMENFVNFEIYDNLETLKNELKEKDAEIVALELTDHSIDYTEYTPKNDKEICIILGNEEDGVSEELLELADISVHLPVFGKGSSINVSSASGVMLYYVLDKKMGYLD